MRFTWNERKIRWFLDASAYTGFHKALAQKIIPHLDQGKTLCDLGCGLGRLDLELAAYVCDLTAVDIDENVIDILHRDTAALGIKNLRALTRDVSLLTRGFDVILMSFFGRTGLLDYLKLCHKLIRIVGVDDKSGLYPEKYRCTEKDTVPIVQEFLDTNGIDYKLELHSLEFGQPFRSWNDAELYVLENAPTASICEVSDFLNARVAHIGREDFPFYLPNQKEFGIFITDKED